MKFIRLSQASFFALFIVLFVSSQFAYSKELTKGHELPVQWEPVESLNKDLPDGIRVYKGYNRMLPLRAWYVYIDQKQPDITTRVVVSADRTDNRETVSSFAKDLGACVVVNGGFFRNDLTPSKHVGLLVSDGSIITPATNSILSNSYRYHTARAAIGFKKNGDVDIAWVTTHDNKLYEWAEPPNHRPGQPVGPQNYQNAKEWNVRDAIGAGPALVVDGNIHVTSDEEAFFAKSFNQSNPRTAAGVTADGALILLVVDGRQPESKGVTLDELSILMHDLGAVDAINLDGGGSSTLVVNNSLVNRPAGGVFEREVMSAIATFCGSDDKGK
jgi:exopolysaccharide biosynthesis protein